MQRDHTVWVTILLGVLAIVFAIAILVGWSLVFTHYYTLSKSVKREGLGVGYWLILAFGCLFLLVIVVTILLLLIGNVRRTFDIRRQNVFIDGVTHEFKSPLASIRLCLETMEMRDIPPAMQKRFIQMMMKDVERLSNFIEHILVAGRLEHNDQALHKKEIDLYEMLKRVSQIIRDRYESSHPQITLPMTSYDEPLLLLTDPIALETILINLLDNAVKYSPEPAKITIAIHTSPEQLHLTIQDQGIGIPKRQLKRVFQRFYRIPREQTPIPRGTGLGLYVVASLVQRLSGYIYAESEGENKGSTFHVLLPRPAPPQNSQMASVAKSSAIS